MARIGIEQPPEGTDIGLKDYLVRQLVSLNNAISQSNYFVPRGTLPNKVRVGETYYFKGAITATPITGEGLWIYKSTGWTQII